MILHGLPPSSWMWKKAHQNLALFRPEGRARCRGATLDARFDALSLDEYRDAPSSRCHKSSIDALHTEFLKNLRIGKGAALTRCTLPYHRAYRVLTKPVEWLRYPASINDPSPSYLEAHTFDELTSNNESAIATHVPSMVFKRADIMAVALRARHFVVIPGDLR